MTKLTKGVSDVLFFNVYDDPEILLDLGFVSEDDLDSIEDLHDGLILDRIIGDIFVDCDYLKYGSYIYRLIINLKDMYVLHLEDFFGEERSVLEDFVNNFTNWELGEQSWEAFNSYDVAVAYRGGSGYIYNIFKYVGNVDVDIL